MGLCLDRSLSVATCASLSLPLSLSDSSCCSLSVSLSHCLKICLARCLLSYQPSLHLHFSCLLKRRPDCGLLSAEPRINAADLGGRRVYYSPHIPAYCTAWTADINSSGIFSLFAKYVNEIQKKKIHEWFRNISLYSQYCRNS